MGYTSESADTRELFSAQHTEYAVSTKGCFKNHYTGYVIDKSSDNRGIASKRMRTQRGKCSLGGVTFDDEDDFAFVCNVERIQTEGFAESANNVFHRNGFRTEPYAKRRIFYDLVAYGRNAAASRVSHELYTVGR